MAEVQTLSGGAGGLQDCIVKVSKMSKGGIESVDAMVHQLLGDDHQPTVIIYIPSTKDTQEATSNHRSIHSDSDSSVSGVSAIPLSLSVGDLPLPVRVSKSGPPSDPLEQQVGKAEWVHGYFFRESPEWLVEPDMSLIKEIVEPHLEKHGFGTKDISVEFFAGGALNKLYTITSTTAQPDQKHQCIFRVTMPVDPWYKTESEVATIEYVRRHTSIPVPEIYAFDSSVDNKLGFEWIMMEKVKGQPLLHYWDTHTHQVDIFDMATKLQIARTVAEWVHQLSKLTFDRIGSLYIDWDTPKPTFKLGRVVDADFFRGRRLAYKVFRGPFRDIEQYYRSVIELQLQEIHDPTERTRLEARLLRIEQAKKAEEEKARQETEAAAKNPEGEADEDGTQSEQNESSKIDWDHVDDEDDWYREQDFTGIPKACHALLSVLPVILFRDPPVKEPNTLYHFDISVKNVLVDDSGSLVGLVDWEIINTSPYENLRAYPGLLDNDGYNITTLELWDGGEKDKTRLSYELHHVQTLLCKEFRTYLEHKASPWLRAFAEPSPESTELMTRVHEIPSNQDTMEEWAQCIEQGREWDRVFGGPVET
ncbi:MAG: Phosphotransferase enzyme [Pleopsidium flavum]|nr:MAG: Phosphotransferase enzyme [Pleopsidium flavum]